MSKIDFEIKGMGKLIKENKFFVPQYQRPFAWQVQQINELFEDIKNNINEEEYFLGTVVLAKKDADKLEIIDGQQRISAIVIFFAVLREHISDKRASNKIQEDYLSEYDERETENIPKLKLNQQDNNFFREYIINRNTEYAVKIESHRRIKKAFEISENFISKLLESNNKDPNVLYDYKDFINNRLKVVVISVPSDANAFTIFETLNDRGLELAQIDLLKNYLYSKAGDRRLEEAQNSWIELTSKIESSENESLILTYIRHYWIYQHGFIRLKNKELYNDIKKKIKNSTQVITFINGLKNDADIYLAILNHNSVFWNDYDKKCKEYIETLNYFGLEQYRPLLLSVLKKFNKEEVTKSLKLILSWLVRNLITGSLGGGSLEQAYANKSKEIFEGKIKNTKELLSSLKEFIPQDEEFKEKFKIATVTKHKFARYYLATLENYHRGKSDPELLVNTNPDSVNLEHILPENPGNNWPNFTEEDVRIYSKRIGNLTLMKTKLNNDLKSAPFSEKKELYKKSELWITNSLSNYDDWIIETTKDRQEELSKIVVKAWSIKV